MSNQNYKAYLFSHTALKPICSGVQNAHTIAEMFAKYSTPSTEHDTLIKWAKSHKTIVMRDGGNTRNLNLIKSIVSDICPLANIPFSCFYESDDYMGGILTSVGFVMDRSKGSSSPLFHRTTIEELSVNLALKLNRRDLDEREVHDTLVSLIDCTRAA